MPSVDRPPRWIPLAVFGLLSIALALLLPADLLAEAYGIDLPTAKAWTALLGLGVAIASVGGYYAIRAVLIAHWRVGTAADPEWVAAPKAPLPVVLAWITGWMLLPIGGAEAFRQTIALFGSVYYYGIWLSYALTVGGSMDLLRILATIGEAIGGAGVLWGLWRARRIVPLALLVCAGSTTLHVLTNVVGAMDFLSDPRTRVVGPGPTLTTLVMAMSAQVPQVTLALLAGYTWRRWLGARRESSPPSA